MSTLDLKDGGVRHAPTSNPDDNKWMYFMFGCTLGLVLAMAMFMLLTRIYSNNISPVIQPDIPVVTLALQGLAPRNITLDLSVVIHNPNYLSIYPWHVQARLTYQDKVVQLVNIVFPESIPSRDSITLVDQIPLKGDWVGSMFKDITRGNVTLGVSIRNDGMVGNRLVNKVFIANAYCQFVIGFPDMKIVNQDCQQDGSTLSNTYIGSLDNIIVSNFPF